jgi:ketosteroid isomerase-like protein
MRMWIGTVGLLVAASTARAEPRADVAKVFTAFVDSLSTDKPAVDGIDVVLTPYGGEDEDVTVPIDELKHLVDHPALKILRVEISRSGKSAWIAAEVATPFHLGDKLVPTKLRASAFLALDGSAWKVRAAEISAPKPEHRDPTCGATDFYWKPKPNVPTAAAPVVKVMTEALDDYGHRAAFVGVLSDDPTSLVFGSAPDEQYSGGRAIKAVFRKWAIHLDYHGNDPVPARAGLGPDGELAWVVLAISSPPELCTGYRALFVVAKEAGGWRVVHQHYAAHVYRR